jgi:hypothetical protein
LAALVACRPLAFHRPASLVPSAPRRAAGLWARTGRWWCLVLAVRCDKPAPANDHLEQQPKQYRIPTQNRSVSKIETSEVGTPPCSSQRADPHGGAERTAHSVAALRSDRSRPSLTAAGSPLRFHRSRWVQGQVPCWLRHYQQQPEKQAVVAVPTRPSPSR